MGRTPTIHITISSLLQLLLFSTATASHSGAISSGSGSSSGSSAGVYCFQRTFEEATAITAWPRGSPEPCPHGVTQCFGVILPPGFGGSSSSGSGVSFGSSGALEGLAAGGCWDPMASWALENGVSCDGEYSNGIALDGSFIYSCCEGDSCNDKKLISGARDLIEDYLHPDCNSEMAHKCVEKYTSSYGCMVDSLMLPEEDECAPFVRPLVGCLEVECSTPCFCGSTSSPRESCKKQCENYRKDFVSPGCKSGWPKDRECDPLCLNEASLLDGGDCLGSPKAYLQIQMMLATLDTNRSGTISFEELDRERVLDPTTPEEFKMFDLKGHGDGLDLQEFFLLVIAKSGFSGLEENFDIERYLSGPPDAPLWKPALDILAFGDKDQDSFLSAQEAMMTYGITRDEYSWLNGESEGEKVAYVHITEILHALFAGLRGDFWEKYNFDMGMATRVLVKFADYDRNGEMTMAEAHILHISSSMFRMIDVDMSKGVSAKELETVLRTIGNGMCIGLKIIDQVDVDIIGQLPFIRPSECKILIQPGWSYPKEFEPYGMPKCNATNFDQPQPPPITIRAHKKGMRKTDAQWGEERGVVMHRSLVPENSVKKQHSRQTARSTSQASSLRRARASTNSQKFSGPFPAASKEEKFTKNSRPRQNPDSRKPSPFREPGVSTRIVGGDDTDPLEFPFVVALEYVLSPPAQEAPSSSSGSSAPPRRNLLTHSSGSGSARGSSSGSSVYCTGTLIHPEWVITAAHCVFGYEDDVIAGDIITIGVHADLGRETHRDGKNCQEQFGIERVLVHPGYDASTLQYDVALIKLRGASTYPPVELYDGGDLMYTECRKLAPVAVGWGLTDAWDQGSLASVLQHATVEPVAPQECADEFFMPHGFQMLHPETMMCTRYKEGTRPMGTCNGDSGGPLLAPYPHSATGWVQIGITSWGTSTCDQSMPDVFTRVSEVLPWVLAVSDLGKFPAKSLRFTLTELAIPDGATVDVYKGNSMERAMLLDSLDSKCDAGMTYSSEGQEGLLVVMKTPSPPITHWTSLRSSTVPADHCDLDCLKGQGVRGELRALGCADIFDHDVPRLSEERDMEWFEGVCEDPEFGGVSGCKLMKLDDETMHCVQPKCELGWMTWDNITAMSASGKALTGGLGMAADRTFKGDYRTYVCLRDWDVEEQLACGVKPREFACFRFEERSREFHWFGLNSDLKVARPAAVKEALDKEMHMISPLPPNVPIAPWY